jgi:hypothetical protein
MKDGLYYLMENGSLQAAETLPEADEPGTLDTDRFIYQFCGGEYNGKMWLFPALEVRGLITGFNQDKKGQRAAGMLVYREELDNQPKIKGYNGPMYNGIDDATGRVIIRYEYN